MIRPGAPAIGGTLAALTVLALGLWPPLARPGYELALCTGLIVPSLVAATTALEQARRYRAPLAAVGRALFIGLVAAAAACIAACVHGLRAGFCDARSGLWLFALGPMSGMVLASLWGTIAAELARKLAHRRRAWATVLLAVAGPLGTIAIGLTMFYATPMVFAYDPFVGFFSGSLYDTVLIYDGLHSYRLASLATIAACCVLATQLTRGEDKRLRLRANARPALGLFGVVLALSSAASVVNGSELGHWHTATTIARALGAKTSRGACSIAHTPAARSEADLLARDCDAHARDIASWLGIGEPPPIRVFLFASADQRRSLMGAAHTSIAKPWRREIYLESDEYPHPVIRHELVHAIAGEIGRGPFRIAGGYGGWLPDPGLIEGIAEAAAPRDDELGASEWAAAMRKLGILPRLESLFGLGFFAGAGSTSYTTAGSFVSFVRDRHGPLAIARWYGGEPLAAVTGKSLAQLESEWWAMLDGVPLGDAALAEARLRFDRPGVLGRSCPHVVDRLLGEAAGAEGGDPSRGLSLYHQVLALDPSSGRALFGVASCHDRAGDSPAAEQALAALTESPVLPLAARASASEKLGDLALRAGDVARARKHHEAAQAVMVQEDRLRTLDIKLAYAAQPLAREAIVALLIGRDKNGPNVTEALDRIGRWRGADDHDGTPDYLFARQHFNAKNYALAAARLDDALSRSLALPRVLAEALRLRIRAACALGDGVTASRMLDRFRHLTVVSPRRKQAMAALVARCSAEPIVDRR